MADELNIPTHRYYQPRYNVALAVEDISKQYIYDSGIRKIDARIGEVEIREPLFSLAEPGVWYDPSDLTTLFQDTAGTTPVTTAGQTVALALDKSKGLVLGPELVTNGGFDTSDGWTLGANTTIADGVASFNYTSFAGMVTGVGVSVVAGKTYRVTYTLLSRISGSIRAQVGGTPENGKTTPGTYTTLLVAANTSANGLIFVGDGNGFVGTIDNVSVKELPGFHATQATAASRPTYGVVPQGGRRNLLTYSEQFDNAAWAKTNATVTANSAVAPDGTNSADTLIPNTVTGVHRTNQDLSIAGSQTHTFSVYVKAAGYTTGRVSFFVLSSPFQEVGANFDLTAGTITGAGGAGGVLVGTSITPLANGWFRVSVSGQTNQTANHRFAIFPNNGGSFAGNGTDGILIWGAQLETGSTATNYQRVVTAFDVTEAGVPSLHYLSFDGVDDFLVTPTITPNIDKVQVFAGVRKLSDAATGVPVELSAATTSNNGSFHLAAPSLAGTYGWFSRGTTRFEAQTSTSFNAPITNVLTGLGDISGDLATLRVNGTQAAQNTGDQGTGNYLAYPLYIGRRGGTSLPFNGQLYSLIVRFGANLDANTISNTETWVNSKTGAY